MENYLKKRGVVKEKIVGILLKRSTNLVISLHAVMKSGGAYLPIDPDLPAKRIAYMINDARLDCVITEERYAPLVRESSIQKWPSNGRDCCGAFNFG